MVWLPVVEKLVVSAALPPAPTGTVPRTVVPSRKGTVPVGAPAPGATAATVAVKVNDWPLTTEVSEAPRAVVVAALLTVSVTAAELLAAKVLVAPNDAVRECEPTPSDTVSVA